MKSTPIIYLSTVLGFILLVATYSPQTASAYEYCFLTPIGATICLLSVPEDPVMKQRGDASVKVNLSNIDSSGRFTAADMQRCDTAKGQLGRHTQSGKILCVVPSNKQKKHKLQQ